MIGRGANHRHPGSACQCAAARAPQKIRRIVQHRKRERL